MMDAQRNGSDRSKSRGIFPKRGSGSFNPQELEVNLSEVARYAGGSRYQIDSEMEVLARFMFNRARSLCRPVFGYVQHKIIVVVPGKGLLIENKVLIPCPPDILDEVEFIVTVVCTIGLNLEEDVCSLNTKGMHLEALFLDASGLALLETAARKAHEQIDKLARKNNLFAGCRWEPGCEKIPLEAQTILFNLVNTSAIGVELLQGGVMRPFKSLSFWIPIMRHSVAPVTQDKCRSCGLKHCLYRTPPLAKEKHRRDELSKKT